MAGQEDSGSRRCRTALSRALPEPRTPRSHDGKPLLHHDRWGQRARQEAGAGGRPVQAGAASARAGGASPARPARPLSVSVTLAQGLAAGVASAPILREEEMLKRLLPGVPAETTAGSRKRS